MAERVSSYDPNARLPRLDTRWVWEIDSPSACELIEVKEVTWNGEEWWVRTERLWSAIPPVLLPPISQASVYLNDLSRFWGAVVPLGGKLTGRRDLWETRPSSATSEPHKTPDA